MSNETGDAPTDEQIERAAVPIFECIAGYAFTGDHRGSRMWDRALDVAESSLRAAGVAPPAPSADREKLIAEGRARRKQGTWEGAADLIDRLTDALAAL